jgi:autotransporter-associated beta strand protein
MLIFNRLFFAMSYASSPTFHVLRTALRLPVTLLLLACFSLWSVQSGHAASAIWNGTTDGTWATSSNWSTSPVPGTGDTATFNNLGSGFTTLNLGAGVTLNTLLFDTASAAAYTIGSGAVNSQTLTLNDSGAITMNSTVAANQLFNSALVLGTDATAQTYTLTNSSTTNSLTFAGTITGGSTGTAGAKALNISAAAGGNVILGGIISNGGASSLPITKTGLGVLELNGANTYTGITSISAGTVKLGNATALGSNAATDHTTVAVGATLDLNGLSISENFGRGGATGPIDGFGGTTAILTNSSATAAAITGTINFDSSGAFTVNGTGNISLARVARTNGTSGDGLITKDGSNTLILSGTEDNTSLQVTVNNGVVQLNKGGSGVRALGGPTTTIGTSGTLRLTTGQLNGDQIFASVNMVNNGIFDLQGQDESFNQMTGTGLVTNGATNDASVLTLGENNSGFTWGGVIQNGVGASTLGLTKIGTGIMTITNTNTYTGATQISGVGGGITLDFATAVGATDLISSSSALSMNNTGPSRTQTLTLTGKASTVNSQTFSGTTITGTGTRHQVVVTSGASGTMNLSLGNLTLTNSPYVDFVLPTTGAINTSSANTIFGPLVTVNNGAAYARILGGQIVAFTGDLTYVAATNISGLGGYTAAGNLLVDNTSTGNVIQAAGTTDLSTITVTDVAARTLTIGAGNTLRLGAMGGILRSSAAGSLVVGESGNAGTLTTGTLAGADLVLTNGNATGNITVNSIITNNAGGAVDVTINGAAGATTILSGASTYTGTTVVQAGALRANNNLAFGTVAGGVTVIDGAALELSGGITIGDEALSIIGTGISSNGALRNVSGTNTYGGLVTLAGTSEIQAETGSTLVFDRPGVATAVTTGSPITFDAAGTGVITFNDALVTTGTSNPTIAKGGTGTLNFNAANNWTGSGGFSINGGIVRISNGAALGGTTGGTTVVGNATAANRGSLELVGNITTNEAILLNNSATNIVNANGAIRNISGNNTITGQVTIDNGAGRINSDSGTLTLAGGLRADPDTDSTRTVTFGGAGNIVITGVAANVNTARILAITKDGTGTLTLSGANTHSGVTTVSGGTLNVTSASGVGTGNVVVATNTAFNYFAAADAALAIGGTLGITGGTSTVIGGSIGSTTTSAQINVTGAATISNAAHRVNIFGVPGTTPASGTYTLIQGGAGSSLNPGAAPTLGTIFNNTNFIVNLTGGTGGTSPWVRTANTLGVAITAQTALTAAFWTGGLAGATNVWAASNGTTASNWVTAAGGGATALVPGAGADLTISATTPTLAPTATVLGSNMTIKSLTIADTTNGLGLNADGNTLTITPASAATGITMNASVPASSIAANVALGANQTWTNDSANGLAVSGIVSGAFSLTKAGTGTLTLSGLNTYSGGTTHSAGTLVAASSQALGLAANTLSISGGTLNLANDASIAANPTTVSGNATIISNRATANAGITHTLGTLSIGAQTLTVTAGANVTSGTAGLTFGATTLTGAPTFDVGTGANLTLPVVATSTFDVTKQGAGTLTINGVGTGTGGLLVNAGTATLTAAATWNGNITVASGGTLQNTGTGTNTIVNTATLTVQSGGVFDNQQTGAETIAAFNLAGTGIGGTGAWVNNAAGTTAGTITSTAGITLTDNASVGGAGNIGTASAISGAFALTKVGGGNLQLGAAASTGWTGGLVIEAGNVIGGNNANTFGADTNPITLGHTTGSANTQLTAFNSPTYLQPLTVKGGNTGVATLMLGGVGGGSPTWGGLITLDTHDLTIGSLTTTGAAQVTGGITGTGNLTIDNDGTTRTITLATAAINSTGSISNVGSATGTTTISAPIGSSVTNIAQNSATSALTLSGTTIAYSGATTVSAGTLNITGDAAGGTRSRTTLTVAGGATLNTLNTAGQIVNLSGAINLGAGSGTTTLGFDIGSLSNFDQFNSTVAATTANNVVLNFNGLGGIVAGNYDLLTAGSGLNTASYSIGTFTNRTAGLSYALSTDPTFVRLTAAALSGAIYWGGAVNTSWTGTSGFTTNFATTLGGTNANGTPGVNSNVIFSTSTQTASSLATTLDGAFSIRDLTFNNQVGSGPLTSISIAPGTGGTLTLTPTASTAGINVETGAPASIAISAPITLGAAQTWTVTDAATNLASSGGIGGTADLTKAGAGILTLSGTNNYVGTTTVSAGVLRAGAANGFNPTSAHTIGASGTLRLNGFANAIGSLSGAGTIQNESATASVLTVGSSGSSTFSGVLENGTLAGTLGVTKVGSGTLELSGANTYTGPTVVSGGTLTLSGARTGTTGTITVSNVAGVNAALNISNGIHNLGASSFFVGSAATTAATGTVTQSGGSVSFTGGSQLLIGNAANIGNTGIYNLSGGTLTTAASATAGVRLGVNTGSIGIFNLSDTGSLQMTGSLLAIGRSDTTASNTTNTFNQTGGTANIGTLAMGGAASGSSGVNSTLSLTGGTFTANSFTLLSAGNTNVSNITIGGTADVTLPAFPTARGTSSTATLTLDGGTLRPLASSATYMGGLTNAFLTSNGARINVGTGIDITVSQVLQNATMQVGTLVKEGAGRLALTGASTYTGATTVNGGTLSIAPSALPNTSSLQVGVTGNGAFDLFQDGVGAAFTMANNANLTLGSTTFSGALGFQLGTASDTIALSGTGVLTVNAGGGIININALAGFGVGSYNLVTGANNIVGGANLGLGILPGGFGYSLDYTTNPTILALIVSATAAGDVYWTGDVSGSWAQAVNTNWSTTANGLNEAGFTPSTSNTVNFSATNAGSSPIVTTLDSAFSIQGLKILNSSTGAATINPGTGGTLTVGTAGIEVQTGAPAVTSIAAPVALGAAQTWTVADPASTLRVSGALSGNFNLTKAGAGTLVLSSTGVARTGTSTLSAGTLRLEALGALTTAASIGMTINGGTLSLARDTAGTFNGVNATVGGNATIEVDRLTAGSGVTLTTGSLSIGSQTLTVNAGSNATSGTMALTTGAVTLSGGSTFTVNNNGLGATTRLNLGGIVSGGLANSTQAAPGTNTSLTIRGSGEVDLANTGNTFTGDILVDGGTIIVNNLADWGGGTVASTTSKTITLTNGGRMNVTGTLDPTASTGTNYKLVQIGSGGGTLDISSGFSFSLNDPGQLFGSGALTKSGLGTLVLRSAGGFTGTIDVTAGSLQLFTGQNSHFGTTVGGTTIRSGAQLDLNGTTVAEAEPLTIHGVGLAATPVGVITNNAAANSSFAGPVTLGSSSTIGSNAAGAITLSGAIGGAFDLTINNRAAGGTTLSNTAGGINNGGTISNVGSGSGTTLISGRIGTNVTGVTQNSATSQLTLSGANTYTGPTAINGGILNVGSAETVGVSGPLGNSAASNPGSISFGGGTLQYSAANQNDYSGRFSTAASQAVSIDTNGQSVTFATSLSSAGGTVTKIGAGTLTFTAASGNSYTGTTTVSGGTLLVNNTTGSGTGTGAVTVSNSGTILGGSGTIAGDLTVNAGAVIAPGSTTTAAGTLTLGGSTVVINGSGVPETRMNFGYSNATGNVGAGAYNTLGWWDTYSGSLLTGNNGQSNDLLNFTATTTSLTWNTGGKITLNQIGSAYTWLQGDVFNLLDWTALSGGAIGGSGFATAADFDLPSLGSGLSWDTSRFVTTGAIAVIPEPSRALLLFLGLLGLYFRRRRRA